MKADQLISSGTLRSVIEYGLPLPFLTGSTTLSRELTATLQARLTYNLIMSVQKRTERNEKTHTVELETHHEQPLVLWRDIILICSLPDRFR